MFHVRIVAPPPPPDEKTFHSDDNDIYQEKNYEKRVISKLEMYLTPTPGLESLYCLTPTFFEARNTGMIVGRPDIYPTYTPQKTALPPVWIYNQCL